MAGATSTMIVFGLITLVVLFMGVDITVDTKPTIGGPALARGTEATITIMPIATNPTQIIHALCGPETIIDQFTTNSMSAHRTIDATTEV